MCSNYTINKMNNNITYIQNFCRSLSFALKALIACLFFIMQAIYPDTFTCISVGIIKDMACELEIKTFENNNIEIITTNTSTTKSVNNVDKIDINTKSD